MSAKADIVIPNENFNIIMSHSSSQECNKEILYFLIESAKNDNQLLGFSFIMEVLTKESNVAMLFRNGECYKKFEAKCTYIKHCCKCCM